MPESDLEVIQAVLDGDVDRYAELVDRYQQGTLRLAFSMLGNYEDAKDAAQDAFIRAYRALGRFRGGAKFSTWFYRIVVNVCKDVYRSRARRPQPLTMGSADSDGLFLIDMEDPGSGPGGQLANRELAEQLGRGIGSLPMKQRTAFMLHHVHGLSLDEAADVMHCRVGTVKSHVFRATEHLRSHLSPWLSNEEASS